MSDYTDRYLKEMKEYISKKKWMLSEGIFDYEGSCEGLFSLSEKLKGIDIILIYEKENISDEFGLQFLYKIAKSEAVEVREFRNQKRILR